MNKTSLIILTIIILAVAGVFFVGGSGTNSGGDSLPVENSKIIDGVQYITITNGGGYFPKVSSAKAGIPTKLIVKGAGVFDCSAFLSIKSIGFQKQLPTTGETVIDIGTPVAGEPLRGVCSMGMYSFLVNFD